MQKLDWGARILLVAACTTACAAPKLAALHGTVVDNHGRPIPGASVAVYQDGSVLNQSTTDAGGRFTFQALPREYKVSLSAPGFDSLMSSPTPFTARGTTYFTLAHPGEVIDPARRSPVQEASMGTPWEYGVLAEGGVGTNDRSNYRFFSLGGHAGKVLTPNLGSGLLKGNFEYSVEVFPLWQSYTPHFQKVSCLPLTNIAGQYECSAPYTVGGTFTGVSVTPIQLRWNLTHGQRWMPWLQGAGGVVWTNHKFPPVGNTNPNDIATNGPSGDTSIWNFTPQFGIGAHYFLKPRRSLDFSANAVHISSASLGDKNPGVNTSVQFTLGYTWWK